MATFNYSGYDDDQVTWPGGSPSNGDTITFTIPTDHTISITDDDSSLQDGTDDRDDEDSNQTVVVTDEFGNPEASGQVQPRDQITLTDGTNTYRMTEIFIASSNSYYYIFHDPAPELGVEYTVTSVTTPNSTSYSSFSNEGVVCFAAGTLILTPQGETPVENLRKGDLVNTTAHVPSISGQTQTNRNQGCYAGTRLPETHSVRFTATPCACRRSGVDQGVGFA